MERPILFNTEMVQAIMDGKKITTRIVVKPQDSICNGYSYTGFILDTTTNKKEIGCFRFDHERYLPIFLKPPYAVGDILWVRETWQESECFDFAVKGGYAYLANEEEFRLSQEYQIKWRPSIHMPRKAARLFLKVKDVKAEQLQDIPEDDAKSEGIRGYTKDGEVFKYCVNDDLWFNHKGNNWQNMPRTAKEAFLKYWDDLEYKNDKTRFKTSEGYTKFNPWVWVIEFERVVDYVK